MSYNFFQMTQNQGQQTNGNFEMGGDELPPIPENTQVLAACEEAKWDEYQGKSHVTLKWRIAQPAQFNNRVIFQKLKVTQTDQAKAQCAMRMLAAIDFNAGGRMVAYMQQNNEMMPSGQALQGVTSTPMMLKLGVWELDDKSKSGNWIKSVAPYAPQKSAPQAQFVPQQPQQMQQPQMQPDNGSIPF